MPRETRRKRRLQVTKERKMAMKVEVTLTGRGDVVLEDAPPTGSRSGAIELIRVSA